MPTPSDCSATVECTASPPPSVNSPSRSGFVNIYHSMLVRIVRRRLRRPQREFGDTDDFTQAIWKSLLEQFDDLLSLHLTQRVGAYLDRVAFNKMNTAMRRGLATCRDVRRKESIDDHAEEVASKLPSPYEAAVGNELVESVCEPLQTRERTIVHCRLDGLSVEEIAESLSISRRTVARVLNRINKRRPPNAER